MKKQIKLGAIISFASQAISIIVGLAYSPVMIRMLGQSEYGLYQLVQSVVNYLNLMNFGLTGAYIRYYAMATAKGEDAVANINGLFMRVFTTLSLICLVLGAVLYANIGLLGNQITEADYGTARILLIVMVLNIALSFPGSLFMVYINANERFIFQKSVGIIMNLCVPALNIPLLLLGTGSIGLVCSTLLLSLVRLVVNAYYCRKKLGMRIHFRYFDKAVFLDLFRFTFFIFLSDVVDQMGANVDKFLLGRMMGTISVAIYSVGYSIKTYFTMTTWVVPELFIPEVNRLAINKKDDRALSDVFIRVGAINNFIVLLPITGFILIGKEFIQLWVGSGYETSYYAGILLMLSAYIGAIQTLGVNIQDAKNKHQIRSVILFVIAVVNVGISIWLINLWGIVGACAGTLLSSLAGTVWMNIYYRRVIGLDILRFWKEILKWTVPACAFFAAAWFITQRIHIQSWGGIAAYIIVYSGLYGLLLWLIGLDASQKEKVRAFLKAKLRRGSGLS